MGKLTLRSRHRLLCGSSTNADDVRRVMDGKRAMLFATDPPYAVGYSGGAHPQSKSNDARVKDTDWSADYREAGGDELGEEFYDAFVRVAVAEAIDERAAWYCWHASKRQAMVERVWERHGAFVHQQIIYVKSRPVLTYSTFMWKHEPCLHGWIKGKKPAIDSSVRSPHPTTVWEFPDKDRETGHPTAKPVELSKIPMEVHTKRGDICFEPFSGSGSQCVAGELLGRSVYGLELSPVFCDVIVARFERLTGERAVISG